MTEESYIRTEYTKITKRIKNRRRPTDPLAVPAYYYNDIGDNAVKKFIEKMALHFEIDLRN